MACSRLEPCPSNYGKFFKVFWPIFPENLEVIGLAKLDLWLDQFTIILLYACQIDMTLFMPQAVLTFIFIFEKFCVIRIKRQEVYLFFTIKYFFSKIIMERVINSFNGFHTYYAPCTYPPSLWALILNRFSQI